MKKFLSLVLALVMTMSLVTISAGAKDFTDADKVTYTEAVDVLSAVKVVDGYTDGAFKPTTQLNRGQAAKILCNLILGPTTASALKADAAPFKDVPADSTFAAYIAYCTKEGIIDGYTDGTFRPSAPLTGYAFMKLLLGALGYDKDVEGYNGANWSINVAKRALNIGLDKGLVDDFNGVKPVTREEAALYALNTLKATMVEYDSKTSVSVGGAEVVIAGSKAEEVAQGTYKNNMDKAGLQFAEKYFSNLKKDSDDTDAFERPATTWTLKSKDIGTYADTPDVVYTASTKIGTIYSDLGLSKGIGSAKVTAYEDGKGAAWTNDIVKGSLTKVGGNGKVMEVYYDSDDNTAIVVMVNTYIGKISAAYPDSTTKDAYVKVKDLDGYGCPGAGKEFETESFEKDDIVRYTYSYKTGEACIESMELVEKVTGAMSTYTIEGSVTVAGTKYSANTKSVSTVKDTVSAVNKGDDVTVYLDANGYVLYVDADVDIQYAVVLDLMKAVGGWNDKVEAKLLFTDGTTDTVPVRTSDGSGAVGTANLITGSTDGAAIDYVSSQNNLDDTANAGHLSKYDIVGYSLNSDNEYELTLVSDAKSTASGADTKLVINGNNTFVNNATDMNLGEANNQVTTKADAETVFLVMTVAAGKKDTFAAYKGFANVPTVTLASSTTTMTTFVDTDSTTPDAEPADVVFILDNAFVTVSSNNKDIIYVKGNSTHTASSPYTGRSYTTALGHFYEYDCFVNGEATTIKTDAPINKDTLIYGPSYNSKGILIGQDALANADGAGSYMAYGTKTDAVKNEVVKLGGVAYAYEKDCEVYFIDVDGKLVPGTIDEIAYDEDDLVFVKTNTDGRLTDVYIKVIDGTEVITPVGPAANVLSNVTLAYNTGAKQFTVTFDIKNYTAMTSLTVELYTVNGSKLGADMAAEIGTTGNHTNVGRNIAYNAVNGAGLYDVVITVGGVASTFRCEVV